MTRASQIAAGLMLIGGALSAQQPASPPASVAITSQTPTFKLGVNDVDVDVVVTDNQGGAVRGLTQSDFRVFEDGRPQDISAFSAVEIPTEQPSDPKPTPPPDVVSNADPFEGRLYVMLIDDLHTKPEDVPRLKAVAQQFVRDDLAATDLMSVMHTTRSTVVHQAFTSDKPLLGAAIDRTSGLDVTRQLSQDDGYSFDEMQATDARSTLATLQDVVGRLANVQTRRKTILLLSGGIDYDIRNLVPNDGGQALSNVEPGARTSSNQWGVAVMDAMRTAVDAAMRANVAIYSIDPRGLAAAGGLGQDSLRALAAETGGAAVVGRNDFGPALQRIVTDNSSYYVLAYPGTEHRDGRFHKIDVQVNRPGVTVRARHGYIAPKSNAKGAADKADQSAWIRDALDRPIPYSNVTLDLFAAAFMDTPKNASVLFGTELRGRDLELTGADTVQIAYEAIDGTGKTFGAQTETVTLNLKLETRARIEHTGIRLLNRISLPPGSYQLRVAARGGSGRLGSVVESLVVPDFTKPLVLSGLVLTSTTASATPTPKADDALRAVLPAPPGALRSFPQTDTLAFYAEAYDNETGAPHVVDLRAVVTDDSGRALFNTAETRTSSELGSAAARSGFSARVPLNGLPAGSYTLTVTAESRNGKVPAATRQLRFVVTPGRLPTTTDATPLSVVPCCPSAAAYEVAVRAFAHGDRSAAAVAIARTPARALRRAISSIDDHDQPLLEAAAAMHLELTWRAVEADNIEQKDEQFRSSDTLFQKIPRPSEDPAFAGAWYVAAVEICLAAVDRPACAALAQRGVNQRVAPALTYLAQGIVYETDADLGARRVAANLRDAERAYRQALQADSTSEEARLRLGRVLLLEGEDTGARAELESVLHDTRDARIAYLADLFLAQLAVRRKDPASASASYSAAIVADPSARAPYVGLSSLALLAGDERGARDFVRRWTTRAPSSALDPWTTYRPGLDQLQSMLDTLLTTISR
jgi:VWFA-related protein